MARLKWAVWLYFLLVLFEGALRKWLAPGLATPLLVIRDPVAVYILFEAFRLRLVPQNPAFFLSLLIGWLSILLAMVVGHGSLPVALYGARPLLLHFPAMFIMGRLLERDDIERMGKFLLLLSLIMTPLIMLQFFSPQSAWVNRGVGGNDAGAGFSGALGYFRPSGLFSFTSGVTQFYAMLAAFVFYFWLNSGKVQRVYLLAASAALVVALPFSISRSLIFNVAIALVFAATARPHFLMRGAVVVGVVSLMLIVLGLPEFIQTPLDVMQARFTQASLSEGGLRGTLGERFLGGLLASFSESHKSPFWGFGIGMGTNVGAVLLTGEAQFLLAENEWQRIVAELGMLLGILVIVMRLWVAGAAACRSVRSLLQQRDTFSWMMLCAAILPLTLGSWNQPTALGYSVMAGAFLLASTRLPDVRSSRHAVDGSGVGTITIRSQ